MADDTDDNLFAVSGDGKRASLRTVFANAAHHIVHMIANAAGAVINPATSDLQATGNDALAGILAKIIASPATAANQATEISSLADILAKISSDPATQTTLATASATLSSILTTLQAQRAETIWTDDTNAYFVRVDKGGTITWTDFGGSTVSAPGTGARPADAESFVVHRSAWQAIANGTGYSTGDYLDHFVIIDPNSGVVVAHYWLNSTTELKLASAPSSANVALASAEQGVMGSRTDAKSTATDATSVSAMSIFKQISASIQAAASSLAGTLTVGTHAVTGSGNFATTVADGSNVTLGSKTDAKSTATDGTSVSAMSVLKQISASVQADAASLASLVTGTVIAAGSALIGRAVADASAATGGIASTARLASAAATTNATNVKASAGRVYTLSGKNNASYDVFLVLYDSAANPPVPGTTTIRKKIVCPAGQAFVYDFPLGLSFATGIGYAFTKLVADADVTALAAADITAFNLDYV